MFKKLFSIILIITVGFSMSFGQNVSASEPSKNESSSIVEEFINDDGKPSKLVIKQTSSLTIVSLYTDGILEQKTIANKVTGKLSGFSNFGEVNFEKNISDLITKQEDNIITPYGVGYYSQVASRESTPAGSCAKFYAYLYEKSSTVYSSKYFLQLSTGEILTAIVASIITVVVLKTPITTAVLKELLIGLGISVGLSTILEGFNGSYQTTSEIKDYYATVNGTIYFRNTITKDYFALWNERTGQKITKYLGQHVSAYGKPTDYQVMLSQTILNYAPNCN